MCPCWGLSLKPVNTPEPQRAGSLANSGMRSLRRAMPLPPAGRYGMQARDDETRVEKAEAPLTFRYVSERWRGICLVSV